MLIDTDKVYLAFFHISCVLKAYVVVLGLCSGENVCKISCAFIWSCEFEMCQKV